MITIYTDGKEYKFESNEEAISFIIENELKTYSVSNATESFVFIGGILIYANTPTFFKVGKLVLGVKNA